MKRSILIVMALILFMFVGAAGVQAADDFMRDREGDIPLSMFGTNINSGELIIYPFYEYYSNKDEQYTPMELGYGLDEDYEGKYTANEYLIFIAYGVGDRLAIEFEVAVIDATLETDPSDPTATPDEINESGLGDVEGQIRYLIRKESADQSAVFTYFEPVFPLQKDKVIIGTQDWEFKLGIGAVKGYEFGTITGRVAVGYSREDEETELDEVAIEYLRRVSDSLRLFCMIEGNMDEAELIPAMIWEFKKDMSLNMSAGLGLTAEATDFAPEIGLMFRFD